MSDSLATVMGALENRVELVSAYATQEPPTTVVTLHFTEKSFGFGEIVIKQTEHGVFIDAECMLKSHIKKYFAMLIDSAITDSDQDPVKHRKYNEVMGRACSSQCLACYPRT